MNPNHFQSYTTGERIAQIDYTYMDKLPEVDIISGPNLSGNPSGKYSWGITANK